MAKEASRVLPLVLTAPAATVAIVASSLFGGLIGTSIWAVSKFWQVGFPAYWQTKVEKTKITFPKCSRDAVNDGVAIGIIMSVVMFVTWYIFRGFLPTESIREFVEPFGLLNRWLYLAVFIYWVTFNSLLEEYLFRWFIFEKASSLTNDFAAVFISSLAFTSHHVFGVSKMLPDWGAILASLGVFTGGFVWSLLYKKHRSIWPCYISHVIVDITLFGIAAFILFG